MRTVLLLGACLSLAGCSEPAEVDCDVVTNEIYDCMDRLAGLATAEIEGCIPLQASERIEGTWAQDFEFNQFYENRRLTFEEAFHFPDITTSVWPGEGVEPVDTPETSSVVWVVFEGRRPVCEASDDHRDIWMDRVIESEVIEERPSPWYE